MQFRYYARYSNQCELLEFANTDSLSFIEVDLDNNSYIDKNIEYIFESSNSLSKIIIYLEGIYEINREQDKIYIKLVTQKGWNSVPNSFITKIILNPKSIFCKWCKNYEYIEEIDIQKKLVKAKWSNNN